MPDISAASLTGAQKNTGQNPALNSSNGVIDWKFALSR